MRALGIVALVSFCPACSDDAPPPTVTDLANAPPAGNPVGTCAVPAEAMPASIASPRTVIGTGTPASCTSAAVVDAVAKGGVITFDCGPAFHTIEMDATAKIVNDTGPRS